MSTAGGRGGGGGSKNFKYPQLSSSKKNLFSLRCSDPSVKFKLSKCTEIKQLFVPSVDFYLRSIENARVIKTMKEY